MIRKITINDVASYEQEAILETNKEVNLIYGLNGAGKTILSEYLNELNKEIIDSKFSSCRIEGFDKENHKTLVYNQHFIDENFHQSDTQKGIFTLAKNNAEAKQKIEQSERDRKKLQEQLNELEKKKSDEKQSFKEVKNNVRDTVWQIKQECTGGDRVFDNAEFLKGLKNKKNLFKYLLSVQLSTGFSKTLKDVENELIELGDKNTEKRETLLFVQSALSKIEKNDIFQEVIIGNENSSFSKLIKDLNNSDWVSKGLEFVDLEKTKACPFCQEKTLKEQLINNIKKCFDGSYKTKIGQLKELKFQYREFELKKEDLLKEYFTDENKSELTILLSTFQQKKERNLQKIESKITNPSQVIELESTGSDTDKINEFITKINSSIQTFNSKLDARQKTIENLKNDFWQIQRKEYNSYISAYNSQKNLLKTKINTLKEKIQEKRNEIEIKKTIVAENKKQMSGISNTIELINQHLIYFGITDFKIIQHQDTEYKLQRKKENETHFKTLSEGEKTVITFLYFIELCKEQVGGETKDKIVVIDDPISSLSHMFVFNVAYFLKRNFTGKESQFAQCFILTHNLYFFNELIDRKSFHQGGNKSYQKLFRVSKNNQGSSVELLAVNDIQNEYQAYWSIINDPQMSKMPVVANAMRNVIEYFFGFIGKMESINNIFQKQEFSDPKYKAFERYISRESHSNTTNISDYKDWNYEIFKEAFEMVFTVSKNEEHYKEYSKN